jgi:hypothetical protein
MFSLKLLAIIILVETEVEIDQSLRYRPARLDLHESGIIGWAFKDVNCCRFLIF